MKKTSILAIMLLCPLLLQSAQAASERFELVSPSATNPNQIKFSLGYTLGTHLGKAYDGTGSVTLDPDHLDTLKGEFLIPISAIKTGSDATRDCHLRESLGLDYQLAGYPAHHICDSNDVLPATGDASIKYPNIHFALEKAVFISNESEFPSTHKAQLRVSGTWEIHGQKVAAEYPMSVELSADGTTFTAKGDFTMAMPDFGVQVKPVSILGFNISVEDAVKVKLNLVLKKTASI